MRARRVDSNHKQIVAAFRRMGFRVRDTSGVGSGFPDLMVHKNGRAVFVEVKDGNKPPSARKLTDDELQFHSDWGGALDIRTVLDVEDVMVINSMLTTRL